MFLILCVGLVYNYFFQIPKFTSCVGAWRKWVSVLITDSDSLGIVPTEQNVIIFTQSDQISFSFAAVIKEFNDILFFSSWP